MNNLIGAQSVTVLGYFNLAKHIAEPFYKFMTIESRQASMKF